MKVTTTTKNSSGKSRKEILAEYEKEILGTIKGPQHAEAEIQKAKDEAKSKKNSIRGAMPKGF